MQFPGAILFINKEVSEQVLSVIQSQLFINETMSDGYFISRINNDGYYTQKVKVDGYRILVILEDFNNILQPDRRLADVVMFVKNGLLSIEKNNYGPPIPSMTIYDLYIHKLLRFNSKIP